MSLKQKIKYYIKKYEFTVTGILVITGTIIGSSFAISKNGLSKLADQMGNALKELGKKFGRAIPGLIGTVISLLLKTGGELVSFFSKNIWLLLIIIITFIIEQFKKK